MGIIIAQNYVTSFQLKSCNGEHRTRDICFAIKPRSNFAGYSEQWNPDYISSGHIRKTIMKLCRDMWVEIFLVSNSFGICKVGKISVRNKNTIKKFHQFGTRSCC